MEFAHCQPNRIQVNNTLAAQVDLAGRATVVRKRRDGTIITDKDELIACSGYGNANRNSDPEERLPNSSKSVLANLRRLQIGIAVNNAIRAGANGHKATLDDPVGLYIHA